MDLNHKREIAITRQQKKLLKKQEEFLKSHTYEDLKHDFESILPMASEYNDMLQLLQDLRPLVAQILDGIDEAIK